MPEALTAREVRILELMAGLRDGRRRTIDEVARRFGVTPGRIREILLAAKAKLN